MNDRRDDPLRHVTPLLDRWRGADARLWELTSSHAALRIVLTRPDKAGCLVVSIAPERIEAPRDWFDADIGIEQHDGALHVVDDRAAVRIIGEGVEVAEYPTKPWE